MSMRARVTVATIALWVPVALLAGCGGDSITTTTATTTAATTTPSPATTTVTTRPTRMPGTTGLGPEADQFIIDATALSAALSGISSALLTLDTPSEGPVVVGSVTNYLEIFDTAIETMQGYEIPDEQWEAQREAMVAGGPALSSAIRQFTDDVQQAADSNSTTQLSSATAALTSAIVAFGTFG